MIASERLYPIRRPIAAAFAGAAVVCTLPTSPTIGLISSAPSRCLVFRAPVGTIAALFLATAALLAVTMISGTAWTTGRCRSQSILAYPGLPMSIGGWSQSWRLSSGVCSGRYDTACARLHPRRFDNQALVKRDHSRAKLEADQLTPLRY